MTDQTAYVNTYLEHVMSMVHDQLNQLIQLRTQLKLTESVIAQKDAVIADLNNKFLSTENSEIEMNNLRERARIAEDSFHAMSNKVSHMETLQNQFSELKNQFIGKENQLNVVINQLSERERELNNAKELIGSLTKELEILKAKVDNFPKEKEEIEVAPKKKINNTKKKESVTLELPAVTTIAETNDF